jgi:hypothetical protein
LTLRNSRGVLKRGKLRLFDMDSMSKTKINMRRLKDFAFTELPRSWILREIILSERDELDVSEFVAKAEIWLKLAKGNDCESRRD